MMSDHFDGSTIYGAGNVAAACGVPVCAAVRLGAVPRLTAPVVRGVAEARPAAHPSSAEDSHHTGEAPGKLQSAPRKSGGPEPAPGRP